jgi:hypothetical protein
VIYRRTHPFHETNVDLHDGRIAMIGTHLAPYELRAEIARGGMATVYRAY